MIARTWEVHRRRGAGRYLLVLLAVLVILLLAFLAAEALGVPLLTDPTPAMSAATPAAAAVGVGLLLVDVLLPVPASAVMIGHGLLFGAVAGAALSLVGGVGATLLAFLLGRHSRGLVRRLVGEREQRRADAFLARYGLLALVVTRPVPMVAETVAIAAGASTVSWRRAALAAVVGTLPAAAVYGVAGATVATVDSGLVAFLTVIVLAAIPWLVLRIRIGRSPDERRGRG
ncbi:TVP38/TMEM64 family protein [Pseudonocardia nigra]|uniref:TVP38/TMEM64 family protein n=1 Tax=Pseudonocardia nigra TaxID=1921578 RepID=UPI001C5F0461|nr:VTT domain-containing protein [Pseudonocardia nigra]